MLILSGKDLSAIVKAETAEKCRLFEKRFSRKPCLAVVLVGTDPATLG